MADGHEEADGHAHEVAAAADRRWLITALTLIVAFTRRMLREEYHITHATLQVDHLGADQDAEVIQVTSRAAADATREPHCEDAHGPVHRPGPHQH